MAKTPRPNKAAKKGYAPWKLYGVDYLAPGQIGRPSTMIEKLQALGRWPLDNDGQAS